MKTRMNRKMLERVTLDPEYMFAVDMEPETKTFKGKDVVYNIPMDTLGISPYKYCLFLYDLGYAVVMFDILNETTLTIPKSDLFAGGFDGNQRVFAGKKLLEVSELEKIVDKVKGADNPLNIIKLEVGSSTGGYNFVMVEYEEPMARYIATPGTSITGTRTRKVVGILSDKELEHFRSKYKVKDVLVD